jgi:SAM-dependent methyltransferase
MLISWTLAEVTVTWQMYLLRRVTGIFMLDISTNALERAKARLGEDGRKVHWIVSDIIDFKPLVKFDFWHDLATFHFLTNRRKD